MNVYRVCMVGLLCLSCMTGCQGNMQQKDISWLQSEQVLAAQQQVFPSLYQMQGEVPTIHFTANTTEQQTPFFYITVSEDTTVTFCYSFTKEQGNAQLGWYEASTGTQMSVPLDESALTEPIDNELTLSLSKGTHVFYITGDGCCCNVNCSIQNVPENVLVYADVTAPSESIPSD